jgi:catalase
MTPARQQVLFENKAGAMGDSRRHIKQRHIANCLRADSAYGEGVAGLSVSTSRKSLSDSSRSAAPTFFTEQGNWDMDSKSSVSPQAVADV